MGRSWTVYRKEIAVVQVNTDMVCVIALKDITIHDGRWFEFPFGLNNPFNFKIN